MRPVGLAGATRPRSRAKAGSSVAPSPPGARPPFATATPSSAPFPSVSRACTTSRFRAASPAPRWRSTSRGDGAACGWWSPTSACGPASGDEAADATILLGDINEWWLWGRPLRWLHRRFGASPARRTFPPRLPLLALDRVWVHPRSVLAEVAVVDTPAARRASDHLPVVATLRFPAP